MPDFLFAPFQNRWLAIHDCYPNPQPTTLVRAIFELIDNGGGSLHFIKR